MNFVFLMDPLHTVNVEKDTTFILMLAAYRRKHRIFYLPEGSITRKARSFSFHVQEVIPQKVKEKPFIVQENHVLSDKDVDAVFIRTDPPFDERYLMQTWLLDQLPRNVFVINDPAGIRNTNEKVWAARFGNLTPDTLISCNRLELLKFIEKRRAVIAKPTDGFGGQSVFRINAGDTNTNVILETITKNYTREVILQQYLVEAENGDKRILLLNGEPLGAVLRVHGRGDHRNNFFSGGKPAKAEVSPEDKKIIDAIRPQLVDNGLYFVGIDIVGGKLIEVNVTSPTCLQEMNALNDTEFENDVIDFVEKKVEESKSYNKIHGGKGT